MVIRQSQLERVRESSAARCRHPLLAVRDTVLRGARSGLVIAFAFGCADASGGDFRGAEPGSTAQDGGSRASDAMAGMAGMAGMAVTADRQTIGRDAAATDAMVATGDSAQLAQAQRGVQRGQCVELRAHGEPTPDDMTPFRVPTGESYQCFNYHSPFPEGAQGVVVESILDGDSSVHHMLLYDMKSARSNGSFESCLGTHPDATLIAGWTPGAADLIYDGDVGMQLPDGDDGQFLLELHYLNFGSAEQADRSGLRVCAAAEPRAHTASITWLGTENIGGPFGIPPGETTTVGGTCTPGREGMDQVSPIHLLFALPHMHRLGRHLEMRVVGDSGAVDVLLDTPFDPDAPVAHALDVDILPGDRLETRCTYENNTDFGVPWGPGSQQEMCYLFVLAYPAGALDHPSASFAGATNTCFL